MTKNVLIKENQIFFIKTDQAFHFKIEISIAQKTDHHCIFRNGNVFHTKRYFNVNQTEAYLLFHVNTNR